jgi:ATP-dependent HslUV protease ATP-binding subunit HslU
MGTERVELSFQAGGIERIAEVAFHVNERTENIGARRLHTVMEKLLEDVSFDAPDLGGTHIVIDESLVRSRLGELIRDEDLSRYIL